MTRRTEGHPLAFLAPERMNWFKRLRLFRRALTDSNGRLLKTYMLENHRPKLQIGGGSRLLNGWLNTDITLAGGVFYMDATAKFPFKDNVFEYIFTEHMIEHVGFDEGRAMLRECHRVLKPGGAIRVVTPDLARLAVIYNGDGPPAADDYFTFFRQHFVPEGQPATRAAIANSFVRSWGHQFIYDEETLRALLEGCGFTGMVRQRLGQSDHAELGGLEHESRYPPGLLDYESVALEATKR